VLIILGGFSMSNKSSHESIESKLAAHEKKHGHEDKDKKAKVEQPQLDQETYESLMAQLNEAEQKNSQSWDRILRMQAESENAARRTERDIANAHKFALEKVVSELLPVIDNLERAISAAEENKDAAAILEGVNLTLTMLLSVLEKSGVQQINPVAEPFNPAFHEAVSTQSDGSPPGMVVAVLQKGYLLNERLVRPALVIVSK
jgi:molecular chaperone GrpE